MGAEAEVNAHRQEEALAKFLGVCILIVGLCSFAVVILLIQRFQRANAVREAPDTVAIGSRRACIATARSSQYRPLSSATRRERPDRDRFMAAPFRPTADSASGQSLRYSPHGAAAYVPVSTPSAPDVALSPASKHAPIDIPAVLPEAPPAPSETVANMDVINESPPSACFSRTTSSRGLANGSRGVDLELLCRIDQALTSGAVRPDQASQLLKSYGCDLEELLRGDGAAAGPATSSHTASVLRSGGSPRTAALPSGNTLRNQDPFQRTVSSGPTSAYTSASGFPSSTTTSRPPSTGQFSELDDALLLKIDQALTSGAVRPDQATQLLKSYGCDLEELLQEEVAVRRADSSSGLN